MAHTIQMTVTATLKDGDLIHRILNFKEDVHRELIQSRSGVVSDPPRWTGRWHLSPSPSRASAITIIFRCS